MITNPYLHTHTEISLGTMKLGNFIGNKFMDFFFFYKQGDNIYPCRTSFPIWNQSVVPCPVLNLCHCIHFLISIQFSCSVVYNSLRPHDLQHARPPCPSPTPGAHSDSRPSSQWCHPAISSSVIPFSCLQSLPASESFPMSQLFAWGGQSTGVSASASFPPKKSQGWSSEWTGWTSLK